MLTENDEKWLEDRKFMCSRCNCYIDHLAGTASCWDGMRKGWAVPYCKMFYRSDVSYLDYRDAAEFEARVHKHLMYQYEKVGHCAEATGSFCPNRDTMLEELADVRIMTEQMMLLVGGMQDSKGRTLKQIIDEKLDRLQGLVKEAE